MPNHLGCKPSLQAVPYGQVEVADLHVSESQLDHNSNLSGRVTIAGKTNLDLQRLSVQLSPEDGNGPDAVADVANDGTFNLAEMRDTTYRLGVAGLPDGWYTRAATLGRYTGKNANFVLVIHSSCRLESHK